MPGPGALRQLARQLHDAAEVFAACLTAIQLAISIKFKLRAGEVETSLPQRMNGRVGYSKAAGYTGAVSSKSHG